MSHDIYLQKFDLILGANAICSPKETKACQALLATLKPKLDDKGFGLLTTPSGLDFEFRGWVGADPIQGCFFPLRSMHPEIVDIIYDFMVAGQFALLDSSGDDSTEAPTLICPSDSACLATTAITEMQHSVVCQNRDDFHEIMLKSYGSWKSFRDHIVNLDPESMHNSESSFWQRFKRRFQS